MHTGITVVGLGPSSETLLTRQAWEILVNASEVYVRTRHHPALDSLPASVAIHAFDDLYERAESFAEVYETIAIRLFELAKQEKCVLYAVPGDPAIGEATLSYLRELTQAAGLPLTLIPGISFIEPCLALLELDALDGLFIADALELAQAHHPGFPPDTGVLIAQLHSQLVAANVKLTLLNQYPPDHPVHVISNAGSDSARVDSMPLEDLDREEHYGITTTLFIPPLDEPGSFEAFQEIVAHLRAPEGCPWDREQTHQSLRSHLMEEAFETLEAIDNDDMTALKEELGDLLLQIVLQTQIAVEQGTFLMADVIQHIQQKLIRRHPHVFAGMDLQEVDAVLHNWESLKEEERDHQGSDKGLLDGVPLGLPALAQADEIQARVARVGFDWPELAGVIAKLQEELQELAEAETEVEKVVEMGDLLFSVVNYARRLMIDPEAALRLANQRFRERFRKVERLARQSARVLSDLQIDELEALWQQAKDEDDSQ
jgi:tetrapyrrole methylase family protein/MazG family protein